MAIAYTYPSVTIQQNVFTAKRWGQFPTITYKSGGTAGSEVVTMDSSFNITIQIQSGVSTNAQINAALAAAIGNTGTLLAGDLASGAPVSGHASDTPSCTVGVPLTGGVTAAVKASATIGALTFTAVTAGTAGNAITIAYTTGATAGAEVVSVISNAISVQIANYAPPTTASSPSTVFPIAGVNFTTPKQVIAAIAGNGPASALVVATMAPTNNSVGVRASVATTPVSLTGGLAAAPATVTTSLIVVTSKTNDATQNGATLTLTPGATAGAEVVTMTGNNIGVQIQSGTSTVTQIVTAMNAAGGFSALYTASGTSANTLQAPYQVALTGAAGPNIYGAYTDQSVAALTSSFVYVPFSGVAEDITVYNDETTGTKQVIGSWDGVNNHFIVAPGTTSGPNVLSFAAAKRSGVYLKFGNAAPAFRLVALNR